MYTYNSVKRKFKNRKVYLQNYNFSIVLDSLVSNPLYKYSKEFYSEGKAYTSFFADASELYFFLDFLKNKRTKYNPITVKIIDNHLIDLKTALNYVQQEQGWDLWQKYFDHEREVLKLKEKLIRKNWKKTFSSN